MILFKFRDWTSEGWTVQIWSQAIFRKRKIKIKKEKEKRTHFLAVLSFPSWTHILSYAAVNFCDISSHVLNISSFPSNLFSLHLPLFIWSLFLSCHMLSSCTFSLLLSLLLWTTWLYSFPPVNFCFGKHDIDLYDSFWHCWWPSEHIGWVVEKSPLYFVVLCKLKTIWSTSIYVLHQILMYV